MIRIEQPFLCASFYLKMEYTHKIFSRSDQQAHIRCLARNVPFP